MRSSIVPCAMALVSLCAPAVAQESLPLVYVLSTGGTIAGRGASSTAGSDYERGAVRGQDLVERVPETSTQPIVTVGQPAPALMTGAADVITVPRQ